MLGSVGFDAGKRVDESFILAKSEEREVSAGVTVALEPLCDAEFGKADDFC